MRAHGAQYEPEWVSVLDYYLQRRVLAHRDVFVNVFCYSELDPIRYTFYQESEGFYLYGNERQQVRAVYDNYHKYSPGFLPIIMVQATSNKRQKHVGIYWYLHKEYLLGP